MEDLATCQVGFNGLDTRPPLKDIGKRCLEACYGFTWVTSTSGWFAVFDGHGGPRVADYCSQHMFDR